MQKADPLIRTKLRQPLIRPALVQRARLKRRIAEGLQGPLTLITAPAGFGKTTLAAAAIAGCGMPAAWLSLDKHDNQTDRFLVYLVAALQEIDPTMGIEAVKLMAASPPAAPEAILTSLINDLDATGKEIVLALDDYQFISSQAVHEGVTFLLEHCPSGFHLVIASRSDPALPLSRLRARGQTVELRAADLRFTEPEAAQFLNEVMGLELDARSIRDLEERTEGWIAGLQMAALSMRDREDVSRFIEGFSGTNRHILDYLLEEVLAGQPPEIQQFLLYTSISDQLTAPLCDFIIENRESRIDRGYDSRPLTLDSRSILEYLERANLFLVPLDDERIWYRYHHLFADLLRARLQWIQPDLLPALHVKASAWFEENGLISEAIQHLLAAKEIGKAADLVEHYGPRRLAESDPTVLLMADNLPQEMILARPKIGLYQVWLRITQARIAKARLLINDLSRQLAEADPQSGQQWMQTFIATAVAFLSPPTEASGLVPLPDYRLLDEIPDEELLLRNAADFLYGMALARRGQLERAVEVSLVCIKREKALRGSPSIPTLVPFLSRIYLIQGRLHATADLCREYLEPIEERGVRFIYTTGSMKVDLGETLSEWNCLEEAEKYIREGLQDNEPWRNIMTDGFGLAALARVLLAKRNYSGAMWAVEKLEARLHEHAQPREFDEDLRTLKIRVQLASGNLQNPFQWADEVQLSEEFRQHKELYWLTLGQIRLAQGRFAEVEELLAGKILQFASGSQVSRQLESNLLLAGAAAGQGQTAKALQIMEACLALAKPEGYLRVFLDSGEAVRELLAAYLRSTDPPYKPYAQKILNVLSLPKLAKSPCPAPAGLVEELSGRELEVLQLLAQGRTNQEIARQLIISPGTVKAHTSSIYRKLDVANRTEAVAHARQLGILP